MVSPAGAQRRTLRAALAATLAVLLAAAGCGDEDFANDGRGPAPITISAVIAPRGVTVSRPRIGAGPIELLASNQTQKAQRLELRSRQVGRGGRSLAQTTGPISPGGTASLHANVGAGTYVVSVRAPAIDPAQLVVTARRARDEDSLLVP